MKLVLSTQGLSNKQRSLILLGKGVEESQIQQTLATLGFASAEDVATGATFSLSGALKTLKVAFATNPIGMSIMAITTAVSVGTMVFSHFKQEEEELIRVTQDAANAYTESAKSIEDYADKYKELHDELTNANTTEERQREIKSSLLSLQEELNKQYGDEYGKVNLVTDAYKDQTQAIIDMSKASANNYLLDNRKGIDRATEQMEAMRKYSLGSTGNLENDYAQQIYEIVSKYTDKGINLKEFDTDEVKGYTIEFEGNAEQAEKVIHDLANELKTLEVDFKDNSFIDGILDSSSAKLAENKKILDGYQSQYNSALMAQITSSDSLSRGFNEVTSAVQAYNEALVDGDEQKILTTRNKLNDVRDSIDLTSEEWKRYGSIMNSVFEQADTGLYDFRDALNANKDSLMTFAKTLEGKSKTDLLSMADDGIKDNFDGLVESAEKYGLTVDDVISELIRLGITQADVAVQGEAVFVPLSKGEVISNINALSEGFESLDKVMNSIKEKDKPFDYALLDDSKFKDNFSELGDVYSDFVEKISNSPKDIKSTQSAFDDLLTAWIDNSGALNNLTAENADLATAMLVNMGVANAEEVVTSRIIAQQEQLAAQKYFAANASYDLANATESELSAFVNEAVSAGVARQAIVELMMSKLACNENGITTDSDIDHLIALANAANIAQVEVANAKSAMTQLDQSGVARSAGAEQAIINASGDNLKKGMYKALDPNQYKAKTSYIGGKASNTERGSKEPKKDTTKEYDWIKTALEAIERQRAKLQTQVDDETNSYYDQISALQQLIELDNQLIKVNQSAVDTYTSRWEDMKNQLIQAFGDGKGNELIAKIMNGDVSKDGSKNEFGSKDSELVDSAMDAYAGLNEAEDSLDKSATQRTEHMRDEYAKRVAEIEAYAERVTNALSKAESRISMKKITGEEITEADYKKMISLSKQQTEHLNEQKDVLEEQINMIEDEASPEYYSLKSAIANCEDSIRNAKEQQAEWNEEIKNLPIRKVERYLELLGFIKQDLLNFLDEQASIGAITNKDQYQQLIDVTQKQMISLLEQQKLLSDKLGSYKFNSDKYNETASEIQDIDNELSELIQSQNEWNQAILQIPIDKLGKVNETLQSVGSAIDDVISGYDSAISAVTGTIDKQVDALNDLKDSTSDAFQDKIDPLQDELDLLQKQNEERKIQLGIEQAQYDLEKAKNQKTNKVIRNGEIVYEADTDALRNANNAAADADYNKITHDLEKQIENLETERDDLLENYDSQIEKLTEIKDKWSQIAEEIKLAADKAKADELLGSGWEDKILSGSDTEMYNSIKDLYTTISDQKNQYEDQIASNERISAMMNEFMTKWQDGSITYEQAMAGIQEMSNQMKGGFSSLEYLDSLLGVNGATDLGGLLDQMQSSAKDSVDQFSKYMELAKINADSLEKQMKSWEEMQENIKKQIAALEELAKVAAKATDEIRNSNKGSSSSSGKEHGYVPSGPGYEMDKNNGTLPKHHAGVLSGYVGDNQTNDDALETMKKFGTEDLKPADFPIIAQSGELVFTPDQIAQLNKNLNSAMMMRDLASTQNYANLSLQPTSQTLQFNMGDIRLEGVQDPDGFARAMRMNFEPLMRQHMSKR